MTDVVTPLEMETPEPTLPADFIPEADQFPCTKCERRFASAQALQGHMSVHKKKQPKKEPCPECGKMYVPGPGMASHRSKTHGVPGARMDKPSNRVKAHARIDAVMDAADTPNTEDIIHGVLPLLFPEGTIPMHALVPLMQWRDDTEKMLKGISNGL